jgi:hypothetical protein
LGSPIKLVSESCNVLPSALLEMELTVLYPVAGDAVDEQALEIE